MDIEYFRERWFMNSLIKYDRTVRIMELEFKIRFIPSFVKRVKEWNKKLKKSESCPFCERWSETSVLAMSFR